MSVSPSRWPTITVEIGFASTGSTAIASTTWTDVTSDLRSFRTNVGRQYELDRFEAGTATVVLNNRARNYDPTNTAGAYYPNVLPMRRIRLRAQYNLLTANQSSLETDTTGWASGNAHSTISRTTAQATAGSASLQLTTADAANSQLFATTPTGTSGFAVTAGRTYTGVASYRAATTGRSMRVELQFYNAAGALLSSTAGSSVTDTTSGWTQASHTVVAPAGSAFAAILVESATGIAVSGETHYADAIGVWEGTSTTWSIGGPADLFSGFVESYEQSYVKGPTSSKGDAITTVQCVDAFKVLSNADLPGSVWELEVRADSPTHWWRLGEASGSTTAVDAIDLNGYGTYNATPTLGESGLVAGDTTTSVKFDSIASANRVDLPNSVAITSKPYSIEAWVKTNITFDTGVEEGFIWFQGLDITDGIFVYGLGNPNRGSVRFHVAHGGVSDAVNSGSTRVDDQAIHHVVCTFTGATQKIYIDGVDATNSEAANGIAVWESKPVAISGNPTGNVGGWQGWLQEIVIYNTALSAARVLAHYNAGKAGASGAWGNQLTGTRVGNILDAISWPSADRNIDAGQSTLQPVTLGRNSALNLLQDVEVSENGAVYMQPDGKVRFRARHTVLTASASTTAQATFGDAGSEMKYSDLVLRYDDTRIRNRIVVQREGGVTQLAEDSTSQASYYKRSYERTGTQQTSDSESLDAANWILAHYKDPALRVEQIEVLPDRDPGNLYPQVLGRVLGDRITVKRRPPGGGTISQDVLIEGISHTVDIATKSFETAWQLSPAETQTYWILGTSALGTDTRIAY